MPRANPSNSDHENARAAKEKGPAEMESLVGNPTQRCEWCNSDPLYVTYHDEEWGVPVHDSQELFAKLILDDDVSKKSVIYPYILTRKEKHLSIRAFTDAIKQKVYEKQKGICTICKENFELSEMEADHITHWHEGGKTNEENCQMLCKECNRRKSGK